MSVLVWLVFIEIFKKVFANNETPHKMHETEKSDEQNSVYETIFGKYQFVAASTVC